MMETDLSTLLQAICPRTYPDEAPSGTAAPYIVWQGIGGLSLRALDGDHCGQRNTYMQISVWSTTRLEALSLIRQVEDALVDSALFSVARPDAEPMSVSEDDTGLRGCIQRFHIWSSRT